MTAQSRNEPTLHGLLSVMVSQGASDLIIKAGGCPPMRVAGAIRFVGDQKLSHETMVTYLQQVVHKRGLEEFRRVGATDRAHNLNTPGDLDCERARERWDGERGS